MYLNIHTGELSGVPVQKDVGKLYLSVSLHFTNGNSITKHLNEAFLIDVTLPLQYPINITSENEIKCSSKSKFPLYCPANAKPALGNLLFVRNFNEFKPLQRKNLFSAVSNLVGVCSDHVWLNNIDWNSKENLLLWGQISTPDFKESLSHATILSFLIGCQSGNDSFFDLSKTIEMMNKVFSICGNGLALDDNAYVMVDCYQWYINSEAAVLAQSDHSTYKEIEITWPNRVKRQEETDDEYDVDENGNIIKPTRSSTILTSSMSVSLTQTSVNAIQTVSTSNSSNTMRIAPTSIHINSTFAAASTRMTNVIKPFSTVSTSALLMRVVPSSDMTVITSDKIPQSTAATLMSISRSSRSAIFSSEIHEFVPPMTDVPEFMMSSLIEFDSMTSMIQMIITPTASRLFSFSINPSIDILDSTSVMSTPTTIIPSSSIQLASLSPSFSQFESQTPSSFSSSSSTVLFSSTPILSSPIAISSQFLTSALQSSLLSFSPTSMVEFITPTPSLAENTPSATFSMLTSDIDFSFGIESTQISFFLPISTMTVETTDIFTITSSNLLTPTRTATLLMPLPTSELSLSISVFTPTVVETSIPIDLTVFTSAVSFSTETFTEIILPPTTTMAFPFMTTPLIPTPTLTPAATTSVLSATTDFFDIETTSMPMFFMSMSTLQRFTESPLMPTPSFSTSLFRLPQPTMATFSPILSSTPLVISSIFTSSPVQTSDFFFPETSDTFFPMTSDIFFSMSSEFVMSTSSFIFVPPTTDILMPESSSIDIIFPDITSSMDFFFTEVVTTSFPSLMITPTASFTQPLTPSTPLTPSFLITSTPSLVLTPTPSFLTSSTLLTPSFLTISTPSVSSTPTPSLLTSSTPLTPSFPIFSTSSLLTLLTPTLSSQSTQFQITPEDSETILFATTMTTDFLMPFSSTPIFSSTPDIFSSSVQFSSSIPTMSPTPTPIPPACQLFNCGNGTCIDLPEQNFVCECFIGWTGQFCDNDIDFCSVDVESGSGLESSSSGFSGAPQFEPCNLLGSSECIDGNSTYTCVCILGFTGRGCFEDIDDCIPNPCLNNGTCTDEINDFSCECAADFTGPTCDIDLTPCTPNPCLVNEICIDFENGIFECINIATTLLPTLTTTSINVSSFVTSTVFNLTQTSSVSSFIQPETTQFLTSSMDTTLSTIRLIVTPTPSPNISICDSIDCGNGTCIDLNEDYRCECFIGWTGLNCDIDIDYCSNMPCDVNGTMTCLDGNSTYTCNCSTGFTGRNCSTDIDECEMEPCLNNATCVNELFGEFTCNCPSNFTGPLCGINLDPCSSNPCKIDEICIGKDNGEFICMTIPPEPTSTFITPPLTSTSILTTSTAVTSFTSFVPSPTPSSTPTPTNNPPIVLNQIGTLFANEGQAFEFIIPENTFFDEESSQLQLSLLDSRGSRLPNTTWVQLRYLLPGRVAVIEGLPLSEQAESGVLTDHVFLLRAEDDSRGVTHDLVTVRVQPPPQPISNLLTAFFEGEFNVFNQNLTAKIEVYSALSSLGPPGNADIYISLFFSGSIAVSFTNLSIPDDNCAEFLAWTMQIIEVSEDQNTYTELFISTVLLFNYIPINNPQIEGPCIDFVATPGTATPLTSGLSPVPDTEQVLLLAAILPTTILACLCLVCGILACILYRRRRSEREQLLNPPMKRAFLNRRPVILAGELDLPPRSRRPVVLTNELTIRDQDQRRQLLVEEAIGDGEESESDEELPPVLLPWSRADRFGSHENRPPPPYREPPLYHYTRHRFN